MEDRRREERTKGELEWQKELLACFRAHNKLSMDALTASVSDLEQARANQK